MDAFELISRKEVLNTKYADDNEVREHLIRFDDNIESHKAGNEDRREAYKANLNALYGSLINKTDDEIKQRMINISDIEKQRQDALDAGNADSAKFHQKRLNDEKKALEKATMAKGEYAEKSKDISNFDLQERRYNSFADIISELYESQITEDSSKYFNDAVDSAKVFIQNMRTDVTNEVDLYEEIVRYYEVREKAEKYISKRTSIFGKHSTKGKKRLDLMTSLVELLDMHEESLAINYNKLLVTEQMKYIFESDNFEFPRTLAEFENTKYAKRIHNISLYNEMENYVSGSVVLNQKFLDKYGKDKDFKMHTSDDRFSQAFTVLAFNQDGTYRNDMNESIAKMYIDCFDKDREKGKKAIENFLTNYMSYAINSVKLLFNDMGVNLDGDNITAPKLTKESFIRNYKMFYMASRIYINFTTLKSNKKGQIIKNTPEFEADVVEVFNKKELDPYWKQMNYYMSAYCAVYENAIKKQAAELSLDDNTLKVGNKVSAYSDEMIEQLDLTLMEEFKEAYRELNS